MLRAYYYPSGGILIGEGTLTAGATVHAQVAGVAASALPAEARVTKPTLWEQYAALPCGQQLGVLTVILLMVLVTFDLPRDVQDQIWGLITTLGAAGAAIKWITKT